MLFDPISTYFPPERSYLRPEYNIMLWYCKCGLLGSYNWKNYIIIFRIKKKYNFIRNNCIAVLILYQTNKILFVRRDVLLVYYS